MSTPDPICRQEAKAVVAARSAQPLADSTGRDVAADVAAMWNCPCNGACSALDAVRCLYHATVEQFDKHGEAWRSNPVLLPLGVVVSRQRSQGGQAACRRYAEALSAGDHAAALSVCHALIDLEQEARAR